MDWLRARKWASAFRRNSRIHCGSDLKFEIFSTISRLSPFGALEVMLSVVEPVLLLVVGIDHRELLILGQDGCFGSSHCSTSSLVGSLLTAFRVAPPRKRNRGAAARRATRSSRRVHRGRGPARA